MNQDRIRKATNMLLVGTALCVTATAIGQTGTIDFMDAETIEQRKGQDLIIGVRDGGKKLVYSVDKQNVGGSELGEKKILTLKDGRGNIYMQWTNPITHVVQWTDSTYDDPFDTAVKGFAELLAAQFQLDAGLSDAVANVSATRTVRQNNREKKEEVEYEFHDLDLVQWKLIVSPRMGSEFNDTKVLKLMKLLQTADSAAALPFAETTLKGFQALTKTSTPEEVINGTGEYEKSVGWYKTLAKDTVALHDAIIELGKYDMKVFPSKDSDIRGVTNLTISNFLTRLRTKQSTIRASVVGLGSLIEEVRKSVDPADLLKLNDVQYRLLRRISLQKGKVLQARLNTSNRKLDKGTLAFIKNEDLATATFTFYRSRSFVPVVSTGIAFTPMTMNGFGTATDSTGATIVAEANKEGGSPVFCTMLNWYVNTGQSDLVPIIQLGLDPTKERPFFLLGAGLFIPATKISVSGGLIWRFDQTLKSLKLGEVVEGTATIQEDIKYTFNATPNWYVGLNYNINF